MPSHLRRHDELGHVHFLTISCYHRLPFFGSAGARDVIVNCMDRARQRLDFRWIGYVIMPEHVHWLIFPQPGGPPFPTERARNSRDRETLIPISEVLESLKTSIGRRVKGFLRRVWADQRTLGDRRLDEWALARRRSKSIWTRRGIDFNVTTEQRLLQKLDYCHANPVKRGLVDRAELWRWSSYRYYELDDSSALKMDWDGVWPIV
ncbi:MAG: hypothetical protein JXQ75_15715 [Phycisphaerae bacterium]|nr:hypothetical protein [Phycisphaerae bacterium]